MEDMNTEDLNYLKDEADVSVSTDWENPPKLEDLKYDIEQAKPHHDNHVSEVVSWLDNLNVTGGARITKVTGRSSIVPRLIRKQAEWRYAALSEPFLSSEDLFDCQPRTHEDVMAARQAKLLLNYQFTCELNLVKFIDDYVRAAVDEGSVLVRVGWEEEKGMVKKPKFVSVPLEPDNPEHTYMAQMLEQAANSVLEGGPAVMEQLPPELQRNLKATFDAGVPTMVEEDGTVEVKGIVKNQPTIEVCDYENLMIDPSCKGDLDIAQFIAYDFETSKSELQKAELYQNLDEVDWEGQAIGKDGTAITPLTERTSFNFQDQARMKVTATEYWGFWDIDGSGVTKPIVSTWIGNVMIRLEESPFPDKKLPFVLVPYLPRRKSVYGEPDGALLEDNQKIVGAVTRGMIDIMGRSANGQQGMRKDALDVTNQRKFEAGKDYYFNPNVDPRASVYMHTFPEIPQSAPFMIQLQNNEAEALTGVKAFHGGISGEGLGESATAARSALDAASKRELGILRRLSKGLIDIGRKVLAMDAEFLEEEKIVRITDEEFVKIKPDDLSGKYDIRMQISTAESDNAKAQELSFMLQTMGQTLPPEVTFRVMAQIARLRKMPETAKMLENYQPPEPSPFEQRMQELQLEKEAAEIDKLRSEVEENKAEAQKDLADAGLASSKRDELDLDYVQKADGTEHKRNLETQSEQAKGNMLRDAIKARFSNKGNSK